MKKFSIFILLIVITIAAAWYYSKNTSDSLMNISPTPLSITRELTIFDFKGEPLAAHFVQIEKLDRVSLLPNFDQKLPSQELATVNQCRTLVSGGFYTEKNTPTGLFISENNMLKQANANSTLTDGFIVSNGNTIYIGTVPQNEARWALQAGPLLFLKGQERKLSLVRDENARRVVALKSNRGHIYFVIFYKPSSAYSGPLLVDLPAVVSEFAKAQNIGLTDAINLDGGSASAFVGENVKLSEISSIGSFFCIK